MPELLTIDVDNTLKPSEDFYFLKKQGIKMIEELSGRIWSDYNTHDPGITLLEALCYAITDLGYRTSIDVKDLLATADDKKSAQQIFYTARQILPCNPVTLTDYRKLIIDTEGVRNAWVEVSNENETSIFIGSVTEEGNDEKPSYRLTHDGDNSAGLVTLNGLYKVYVEFEDDVKTDAQRDSVIRVITDKLLFHRNLCEDIVSISSIEHELFTIKAELRVSEGADIEKINAQVYKVIHDFISPPVIFYTLEQMLERGYTIEEIFEGPVLKYGFIDTAELENSEKYKAIHISDIINIILGIEGVIAITSLSLPAENADVFSDFNNWLENIQKQQKRPKIDTENSVIIFARNGDRHRTEAERQPDKQKVRTLLSFMQLTDARSKLKSYTKDVSAPAGEDMSITEYYPVQYTLPTLYGTKEKILDTKIDEEAIRHAVGEQSHHLYQAGPALSAKTTKLIELAKATGKALEEINTAEEINNLKKAWIDEQAKILSHPKKLVLQLKGFLLFFEQLMSDYLLQLSSLKDFFSFDDGIEKEYSPFMLKDMHDFEGLIIDYKKYLSGHDALIDTDTGYFNKRANILNHLLGRFAEDMYVLNNSHQINYNKEKQTLQDKTRLLKDYIQVSNYRGKGYTYNKPGDVWDTDNVEGVKKRICRLTGIATYKREHIASDAIFIEEILLENGAKRFIVLLVDPNDRGQVLLRSDEYEFRGEAEDVLNYIMINGADKKLFVLKEKKGKSHYYIKRQSQEEEDEIVASHSEPARQETERAFKKCQAILSDFSKDENFHVLEHILLRPRIIDRENDYRRRSPEVDPDTVRFLPVNEIEIDKPLQEVAAEPLFYKFRVINRQAKQQAENPLWSVELIETESEDVILVVPDTFVNYKHGLERIDRIKKAAADQESYTHRRTPDGFYILKLNDKNHVLAESKKRFLVKEEMDKLQEALTKFFSFEFKEITTKDNSGEPTVASLLDPYSFQVSMVLPNWPARFRDVSFRHLLEKAIYLETPAHITPTVYWVNHQQMLEFENAYRYWIQELSENEIPNAEITNKLVHVLHKLKQ